MELKIYNPVDGNYANAIEWNFEELRNEVVDRVKDYKTVVYSEDQIQEAKQDRAKLNKLKKALDDKRKEIEKGVKAPYEVFKKQVQEIVKIIDEASTAIDTQVKAFEEQKKNEKLEKIAKIWNDNIQDFKIADILIKHNVFKKILDSRWLNVTVSLKNIEKEIEDKLSEIQANFETLDMLPEFSFESKQVYLESLDINRAIQEGKRLSEIQKAKEEYLRKQEEIKQVAQLKEAEQLKEYKVASTPIQEEKIYIINFSVSGNAEQLNNLKNFLISNNIEYKQI